VYYSRHVSNTADYYANQKHALAQRRPKSTEGLYLHEGGGGRRLGVGIIESADGDRNSDSGDDDDDCFYYYKK